MKKMKQSPSINNTPPLHTQSQSLNNIPYKLGGTKAEDVYIANSVMYCQMSALFIFFIYCIHLKC